jgi:protein TonB
MAFRALVFSKNPETNNAIAAACQRADIRAQAYSDIFSAIEKAKTQTFSCVIADWADQPEASFLLKRARESVPNRDTVAIAIIDHEPATAEVRDNRLAFLIQRPISAEEADAVLSKASQKMQPSSAQDAAKYSVEDEASSAVQRALSSSAEQNHQHQSATGFSESTPVANEVAEPAINRDLQEREHRHGLGLRGVCAAALILVSAFVLWRSRETLQYLAQTPEGRFNVIRESVAALFNGNQAGASPVSPAASDAQSNAQREAYYNRLSNSNQPEPVLGLVATESTLDTRPPLPKPADLPLPVAVLEHQEPPPVHVQRAAIPESMRNSAPIAPPVVVTVGPAQMMPVSAPQPQPAAQQFSEPVAISEESARALLVHSVDPVYPPEGLPQKLHGAVVLQAVVGRDGGIEDLKLVRGNFILGRAAIAAVKQWRFQPYSINGHAAETQTTITVNFTYPG